MTMPDTQLSPTSIHPDTTVGLLSLTVADLERSLAFYTESIGFQVLEQNGESAVLGAGGRPLLQIVRRQGAQPWPRDTRESFTGLYHFAILLPTRADLGRWLTNWVQQGWGYPGQGDHLVSEALYLEDPDGNGIEVYRDRPRSEWQWSDGRVRMGTGPVDLRAVLAEAEREGKPWSGLPAGTRIGHVHLQVGSIREAAAFYHDVLGFDIVAQMPTALFISAGGYHHHIGLNTWHSLGAGPAPEGFAGLRHFTIELPDEAARQVVLERVTAAGIPFTREGDRVTLRDPFQNVIVLRLGADTGAAAGA